jgi:hypothetical protein
MVGPCVQQYAVFALIIDLYQGMTRGRIDLCNRTATERQLPQLLIHPHIVTANATSMNHLSACALQGDGLIQALTAQTFAVAFAGQRFSWPNKMLNLINMVNID